MTARILVVDDVPGNLAVACELLAAEGHAVRTATTAADGLALAGRLVPDLILLDVRLPDEDGVETCRRLKADPRTAAVPVLFMTALGGAADKVRGFAAGGADWITKPFDRSELAARVAIHLELAARRRDFAVEVERRSGELQAAMERVRRSEHDAMLGRITGGLAHHLNNRLAAIIGCGERLELHPGDPRAPGWVRGILHAARESAALVQRLAGPAAGGGSQAVDAHALIAEMRLLLIASQGGGGAVALSPADPGPAWVRADRRALQDALLDLVANAREAQGPDGAVEIATARIAIADGVPSRLPLRPGPHLRITVLDRGPGIPAADLARIFEPFFTTKAAGSRFGLGLPAVHALAASLDGSIEAEPRPGGGMAFHLVLPCCAAPEPEPPPALAAPPSAQARTLLVVDDEAMLLDLITMTLTEAGYEVVAAKDGRHALHLVDARPGGIDAALVDLTMPDMSGAEVFEALRVRDPGLPVGILSGQAGSMAVPRLVAAGAAGFLAKPFTAAALTAFAASVLAFRRRRTGPGA